LQFGLLDRSLIPLTPCPRFVILDVSSRSDLIRVMTAVQQYEIRDQPVLARIKATTTPPSEVDPTAVVLYPLLCAGPDVMTAAVAQPSDTPRRKKTRPRKRKSKRRNVVVPVQEEKVEKSPSIAAPPSLDHEEFPNLQDDKVEWDAGIEVKRDNEFHDEDEDDDEDEDEDLVNNDQAYRVEGEPQEQFEIAENVSAPKALSDSASTATTMSSSSSSKVQSPLCANGGYAAALKKSLTEPDFTPMVPGSDKLSQSSSSTAALSNSSIASSSSSTCSVGDPGAVGSPSPTSKPIWGGRRSFADAVRQAS
jgi:hypothetical protein